MGVHIIGVAMGQISAVDHNISSLLKGSAMTAGPHRPSVPTISEVGSIGPNSQSGMVMVNNLTTYNVPESTKF